MVVDILKSYNQLIKKNSRVNQDRDHRLMKRKRER